MSMLNIEWKAVAIALAAWVIAFKMNNMIPLKLNIAVIAFLAGFSLALVYLSRLFIKVERSELIPSAAVVLLALIFVITYISPATIGITNQPNYIQIPGTQGILDWIMEDLIGIPMWVVWGLLFALVLLLFIRPILAIGLALLLFGIIMFPILLLNGVPGDELIGPIGGLVMCVASLFVEGKSRAPPVVIIRNPQASQWQAQSPKTNWNF